MWTNVQSSGVNFFNGFLAKNYWNLLILTWKVCVQPCQITPLSTWHCPHLLLSAVLRRRCCWACPQLVRGAGASYRSISFASGVLSSKPAARRSCCWTTGQTGGRTDGRSPFRRPCSAWYAGQGCSGKFWWIWGNGFRDQGPSNGGACACSRAGGGCGRGSPPPLEEVRGCHPEIFWRFLMPNPVWGDSGQKKINWSRVNLTSTTWFAGTLQC